MERSNVRFDQFPCFTKRKLKIKRIEEKEVEELEEVNHACYNCLCNINYFYYSMQASI